MRPQSLKNQLRDKKRRTREKLGLIPNQGIKRFIKHYRVKTMRNNTQADIRYNLI